MKAHAPPPPRVPQPAPRQIFKKPASDGAGASGMDAKQNMLKPTVELKLTLPHGHQTSVIEDGSKALMDLLVELCSRYHLNPALHTLELLSPEGHSLGFKPNALLGSFNVARVLIKEKVWEEKVVRRPAPKVPEKTVRLMVNFHGSQKAVVRVNPLVPLRALIPVICDKCEFEPSNVLLMKDGVSRYELPLDESLTDLGIKELYVHDQTLDSTYSSTTSLGRSDKKGFLGVFQFNRGKSKTDSTSKDMDDYDDKIIQYTDIHSDTMSTVSGIPCVAVRTGTLGTSQSEMNIPRMSPKADNKKRRAPAPPGGRTHSVEHTYHESAQMGIGSESQQRKRKAPAPPPTPTSVSQVSDDASASAAPTPDSDENETSTPALFIRVAQSAGVYAPTVVTQTAKPAPIKVAVKPLHVYDAVPARNSPTPSSSTVDSLTAQDSSSELSHSLDDSDADLDQSGSQCSTLTSSSASESMRVVTTTTERLSMKVEKSVGGVTAQSIEVKASDSNPRLESESALNLKLDEMENNRHSTIAWLHTAQSSAAESQKPATEDETLSLSSSSSSSSSGSSSLPDQGYAASEGMTEGEDSRVVSSLSDTQPNSPEENLSLDGSGVSKGEKMPGTPQDSFHDIDEGCATWGSIHRHSESAELRNHDDHELTVQLHQTLADFETDLAGHLDTGSTKDTTYTIFMDNNEVPVSVVDMDVPVTAIDDVLEEYEHHTVEHKVKSLTRTEFSGGTDSYSHRKAIVEPQNKNNNAYTTAVSDKKSTVIIKQVSQSQYSSSKQQNKLIGVDEEKVKSRITKSAVTHAQKEKENIQTSAMKADVYMQKNSKSIEYSHNPVNGNAQKQTDLPSQIQTPVSPKKEENIYQNTSSSTAAQSKITRNVTSRFGMKTFTVVPPKPVVVHTDSDQSAARLTVGAIKIDDQGNMVSPGVSWNKNCGLSESENTSSKDSTLGKAKTFWSSSERQETVHSKRLFEKPKESTNIVRSAPTAVVEIPLKTCGTEHYTSTQSALSKIPERVQSEMIIKEVAEVPVEEVKAAKREQFGTGSKISVSKSIQPPSNKPVVPSTQLPDLSKDLSFLKPARRTSSQYVASAISKYAPTSTGKSGSIPKSPDNSPGIQRPSRSIQVNPHQSSQSIFSDNKENVSVFTSQLSKRSMSFPEFMSESQRDFGEARKESTELESQVRSTKESSHWMETDGAKNVKVQINGTTQIKATNHNDRDNIRHIRTRSPSPQGIGFRQPATKPSTVPKILLQGQTNSVTNRAMFTPHLSSDVKPQPPVTVTDSGVTSGPPAVTLFGPITKFKPVIQKAVEKETSLHSSLMEAIQTGGGKERLKKISTSETRSLKKGPYMEEETERSALLAAIRAQNSTSRLKKTKSQAANELEKFRKVASEEERHLGSSSSSLTHTTLVFNSPPHPAAMTAPPPPPLVLPQSKPRAVAYPNTNTPMNPALAREAMLEAIRSGSAADKLKKVAPPKKTVQVNGRLGTMKTASSAIP